VARKILAILVIIVLLAVPAWIVQPIARSSMTGGTQIPNAGTHGTEYFYNPDNNEQVTIHVHVYYLHPIPYTYTSSQRETLSIQKMENGIWKTLESTIQTSDEAEEQEFYINDDMEFTWDCTIQDSNGQSEKTPDGEYRAITLSYGIARTHYFTVSRDTQDPSPPSDIPEPWSADEFRQDCLDGGSVSCTRELIHGKWLASQRLSRIWWSLAREEREAVAGYIIRNYLFFEIPYRSYGLDKCGGATGEWMDNQCSANALIRFVALGDSEPYRGQVDNWYWSMDREEIHCYCEYVFRLPVYPAVALNMGWSHAMAAFQVGQDEKDWESWILFQYDNEDIQPGDWQLPLDPSGNGDGLRIAIGPPSGDDGILAGGSFVTDIIAQWHISSGGTVSPLMFDGRLLLFPRGFSP